MGCCGCRGGCGGRLRPQSAVLGIAGVRVLLLVSCFDRGWHCTSFLGAWVLLFFTGAVIVFFAGSARYLLPIAAPVAILVTRACGPRIVMMGFALQMALSLGLAIVNYQHWGSYRQFAASVPTDHRVWINAEWGLRYYLESRGALPMARDQILQPGDTVVTSTLALPLPMHAALAPVARREIRPSIPLRIISLDGRSAYSSASLRGLLPFEISTAPIDRVRAEIVVERKPELTYIDPRESEGGAADRQRSFAGWVDGRAGHGSAEAAGVACAAAAGHQYSVIGARAACAIAGGWSTRRGGDVRIVGRVHAGRAHRNGRPERYRDDDRGQDLLSPRRSAEAGGDCDRSRVPVANWPRIHTNAHECTP